MSIRMAIPNKGRLSEKAIELLSKSGIGLDEDWGRSLHVKAKNLDVEIILVRAQDIPSFIDLGVIDFGITGEDMVAESGFNLLTLAKLCFGVCRLSVAAPESCGYRSIKDIPSGTRIATSFPNLTKRHFESIGKNMMVIQVSGAVEIMPLLGVSDVVSDLVATGSTLKAHRMAEIGKIMDSQAAIFASESSMRSKGNEINDIVDAILSVIVAEDMKYLMADVPKDKLDFIMTNFPGIGGPTVMNISGNDSMVAIHVVVPSSSVYDAVNQLKKLGAKGILSLSIERLVE